MLLKKDKPDSPTLGRKELSLPSTLVQAKVPTGQTTTTVTTTTTTPSLLASSKNTLALDRKMAGMGPIKVLSGGGALLVGGGAKTGSVSSSASSPVRTIRLSSSPSNIIAPKMSSSMQKVGQTLKVQTGSTIAVSSIHAKPTQTSSAAKPTTTNRRTAPTKSAKVTKALQNSNALTTYLLSAGSSGIAELLQAHINQKGGNIKFVPSTSGASSQGIQLVVSGVSTANTRNAVAPSSAVAAGKGVTSVSVSHGSKATPAAVGAGKVGSEGVMVTRPGAQGLAKLTITGGQSSVTKPSGKGLAMATGQGLMKITAPGDGVMRLGGEGSAMAPRLDEGSVKVMRLGGGGTATKAGGEGSAMAPRPGGDSVRMVGLGSGGDGSAMKARGEGSAMATRPDQGGSAKVVSRLVGATKARGEGSVMVAKPGNTILPRHQLAMSPGDRSKLESVVNKIVSDFSTQPPTNSAQPLAVTLTPSLSTQPLSVSAQRVPRLNLTRRATSAVAADASPKIILPGLGETTKANPSSTSGDFELLHRSTQSKPASTIPHSVGIASPSLPTTPPLGRSNVSGIVIPDTPPQDPSQSQTDMSPPMEQIIEEHSYPLTPEPF